MSSHSRGRLRGARLRSLVAAATVTVALTSLAAADAHAASLPNGRAFELVSPRDTADQSAWAGGLLHTDPLVIGDGLFGITQYMSPQFPATGNGWGSVWIGRRSAAGWAQTSLEAPLERQDGSAAYELLATTADASRTLVRGQTFRSVLADSDRFVRFKAPTSLELREADGRRTTIAEIPFPRAEPRRPTLEFAGASDDLRTVLFTSYSQLAGDTHPNPDAMQLYRWHDGVLRVAAVDQNGTPNECGGIGLYNVRTVAADGSLYYFIGSTNAGCNETRLLVSDGTRSWPIAEIVNPEFLGTTPDGRTSYITTQVALTAADTNAGNDLYRSTVPAGGGEPVLACVSCGENAGNDAQVGLYDGHLSADGSRLWFRAQGTIDGKGEDFTADPSHSNLFVLHDGEITLVTPRADLFGIGTKTSFHLSRDGRFALFSTASQVLDGVDPQGTQQIYRSGERADGSFEIACVSCGRTGAAPVAGARVRGTQNVQLSDDGSVVGFTSADALTADAVAGLSNVYEWRNGTLTLLYTGTTISDVEVIGVSGSGADIFVNAHGALAPEASQDVDGFYSARLGGGFPGPPQPPAPCAGSSCQGPGSAPPTLPLAATVDLAGGDQSGETSDERRRAVRLLHARVRGSAIRLDVTVPARGRLTVAGARVRTLARSVRRGGTYRVAVSLTPKARRALAGARRLKVALRVGFRPAADRAASSARLTVTVKK